MKKYYTQKMAHGKLQDYWFNFDFEVSTELKNPVIFKVNEMNKEIFDMKTHKVVTEIKFVNGGVFSFNKRYWLNQFDEPIMELPVKDGILYTQNLKSGQNIFGVSVNGEPVCINCRKTMTGKRIQQNNRVYSYKCDCGKKTSVAFGNL